MKKVRISPAITHYSRIVALVIVCAVSFTVAKAAQLGSAADSVPAAGGGGDSVAPILTPDGRYVLFSSVANNLALTTNGAPYRGASAPRLNVFLRDRNSASTKLVSINTSATSGGNDDSIGTDISTNGQYALFESSASDLVPNDTNNVADVFVRDLAVGSTRLISVATNGWAANGASRSSTISASGRYVAFVSAASNLVPNDTNGIPDVFVADLQSNTIALVTIGARATNSLSTCEAPQITADGRYVAFYSSATNVVPGVTTSGDIYVRDLLGGITYWVSENARSQLQAAMGTNAALISNHEISDDGKTVAFRINPVVGTHKGIIIRHNWETLATDIVTTNANSLAGSGYEGRRTLDMSSDGRFIALVENTNTGIRISRWDGLSGQITPASNDLTNYFVGDAICGWPTVDPSGRYVAFMASGLDNHIANSLGVCHLYLKDMQAGTTRSISKLTNGVLFGVSFTTLSSLSADGRYIAFQAPDGILIPNDSNRAEDIFLYDAVGGSHEMISVHDPGLPSQTPTGPSGSPLLGMSADGQRILFTSLADNVTLNDTNKCSDVFVRDLVTGANYLVSVGTNGWSRTNGNSVEASISADGRYVALALPNGVPQSNPNKRDVFVRDLLLGTNTLVSVATIPPAAGNADSFAPIISADGQRVLFQSAANNIAPGLTGFTNNLFYRNLQSGVTVALTTTPASPASVGVYSASMTPDGRWVAFIGALGGTTRYLYVWDAQSVSRVYTNSTVGLTNVNISPDGTRLAYATANQLYVADWAANTNWLVAAMTPNFRSGMRFSADGRYLTFASTTALVSPDSNGTYDVYLYDLQTRSNQLVSHRFDGSGAASDSSDSPDISPDGRLIAYRSFATNIVANDKNGVGDAFLYDRLTDKSSLIGVSRFDGGPANSWSGRPQFTRNGHQVFFQSWASDLAGLDFNLNGDVFGHALFYVNLASEGLPTSGATLNWPIESGKTYQVEYLNDLNGTNWQIASGSTTNLNDWAYFTDSSPSPNQRFYRIVAN